MSQFDDLIEKQKAAEVVWHIMLFLRSFAAILIAALPATVLAQSSSRAADRAQASGPRIASPQERERAIPGRFVVTLQNRVDARTLAREYGIEPDFVYTRVLTGFAGTVSEAARAGLLRDNRIVRVEPDRPVHATQAISWGQDRLDQRALPLDNIFKSERTGSGVTAYVVDTGIRFDHQEFGGRAVRGYDAIGDGLNGSDCNGHGTHVAGTVGGATYGVARQVRLVSARVLDCQGSGMTSGVIAALDWIAINGQRPGVVNMSLGGAAHTSTDDAVKRLIAAGFTVVLAAGNESADACLSSPARVPAALTIAATDKVDARASFSNYGACVDLFAPGVSITSAWHTSTTAVANASGTSMAAPHVAGAAALLLEDSPSLTPAAVGDAIAQSTTRNIVSNAASVNSHLLYVAPPTSPTISPTSPTGGVTITGTSGNDVVNATKTVSGQPLPTSGADVIRGLGGSDSLSGLAGNDTIEGGDGTDTIIGGPGDDLVDGGTGVDTISYAGTPAGVTVSLGVTGAQNTGGAGTDKILNFERVTGSSFADVITGGIGVDLLTGGAGNDAINGGDGGDTLVGGVGDDQLDGGAGVDIASYADATAGVTLNLALTSAQSTGGAGTDTLLNVEHVTGSNHADVITGSTGANSLSGGTGNDALNGAAGNDTVRGNAGDDIINGGPGNDTLIGDAGLDQFRFDTTLSASANVDKISDFSVVDDKIQLSRVIFTALSATGTLAESAFRTVTAAPTASARIVYDSATGSLYYDADGSGPVAQILFARVAVGLALTSAHFTVVS